MKGQHVAQHAAQRQCIDTRSDGVVVGVLY